LTFATIWVAIRLSSRMIALRATGRHSTDARGRIFGARDFDCLEIILPVLELVGERVRREFVDAAAALCG